MALLASALPDNQLETFVLRAVVGLPVAEIAEQTGVPINAVRSRLRLAKHHLREHAEREPAWLDLLRK